MASSTVPYVVVVDDDLFILMQACDILGRIDIQDSQTG